MQERIELLSPAGDLERLKIACLYGADAIYIGGQNYSLRANALNFSLDDIKEAVLFAHNLNKRVYVTVNIVFHDKDLAGVKEYLKNLDSIGVDAIIVSDVVIMDLWRKMKLKMELHVSTQASALNYEVVNFYKELGESKKMVLSTSLNDVVTSRMMSIVVLNKKIYFQTDRTFRKYKQINPKTTSTHQTR